MDSDLKTSGKQLLKRLSTWGQRADSLIHDLINQRLDGSSGDEHLRVFVSYRRDAGPGAAHHLASDLEKLLGPNRVFLDQRTIAVGEDWSRVIAERVAACDVLLAVIGPRWLEATDEVGQLRLAKDDDYVRHEIEAALERHVPVIPVATPGATLPPRDALPESLKPLMDDSKLALEIPEDDYWPVAVDSLARWLLAIGKDKEEQRKQLKAASEERSKLERELERGAEAHERAARALTEASQNRTKLEAELPAAQAQLAQRRSEAEPSRVGQGLRTYVSFRPETRPQATRLTNDLAQRLGADNVLATDANGVAKARVERCDVLLTLIGPSWQTEPDGHGHTLSDPDDSGRLEMEAALARGIPVIPLLIHVRDVPDANVLPETMRVLLSRQAMPFPDQFWDSALAKLLVEFDKIESALDRREQAVAKAQERERALLRELDRATRQQADYESTLRANEEKLTALRADLEVAVEAERRLSARRADQSPAFRAGPPRPQAAGVR